MYNYSPDKARDPLCTSKTCDKDNTKDEKGEMKMQCYEVLTVYMKLCNIISKHL